jgi:hypothetical protein
MVPDRHGDDDAQTDVEHGRRRDHPVGMLVWQVEKEREVEGSVPRTRT